MSSITLNKSRVGNFTSSEIHKLMSNGKAAGTIGTPFYTYVEEKNIERRLGRCLDTDVSTRPMLWGLFMEQRVFDMLGFEYELHSKTTDMHPVINCWSGSKDLIVPKVKVGDIKCFEPKNFAKYTDVILSQDVEILKTEFPKEYWQLVSNAIISQVPKGEAISYMPYQSELAEIREMAENYDGADQWKYRFIAESEDEALPYLPDGGYYKNLNRFEFEVPTQDIEALEARVLVAQSMLTVV